MPPLVHTAVSRLRTSRTASRFATGSALALAAAAATSAAACSKENNFSQTQEEQICAANQNRCVGDELQICNPVGDGWEHVKDCAPGSCKTGANSCPSIACRPEDFRCTDGGVLERCSAAQTGWEEVKACVAGTCDATKKACEAACGGPDDCESKVCLQDGTCESPFVTMTGPSVQFPSKNVVPGLSIKATNLLPDQPSTTSDANGIYALGGLPPLSLVDLDLEWTGQTAPVFLPLPLRTTRVSVRAEGDAKHTKAATLTAVPFMWLAQVAVDCGIFPDLDAATGESEGGVNPYWVQRSTVVLDWVDQGVKVSRDDVTVNLGGLDNEHASPTDTDPQKTHLCFLNSSGSVTADAQVTTPARAVMFRVRNPKGTGFGVAEARVTGFESRTVSLRSSGQIGVVTLGKGQPLGPQEPIQRTFEGDIVPLFKRYACIGCHSPPGADHPEGTRPGYEKSKPRGPNQLRADFSGDADALYAVLTATDGGDCATPESSERVCVDAPEASLFAHKPFIEPPGSEDHQMGYFASPHDPDYRAIVEWIQQGAQR